MSRSKDADTSRGKPVSFRKTISALLALAVVLVALPACSTVERIETKAYLKPAVDFKERNFTKLAVLPFNGDSGGRVSAVMQATLGANGYYALAERQRIGDLINEMGLQQKALFDSTAAARVGQFVGASHVLLGEVIAYSSELTSETRYRTVKVLVGIKTHYVTKEDGTEIPIPVPILKDRREPYTFYSMNADVSVSFRVVTVERGTIVSKSAKNLSRDFNEGSDDRAALPTRQGILSRLTQAVCSEYADHICPSSILVTKALLKPDSKSDESRKQVERALSLLKGHDLEGAQEALGRALEHDPSHVAALFNLAMVEALHGDIQQAREDALEAFRMQPENKHIVEGKSWIESLPR